MAARRPRKVFPFLALAAALAGCEEQELTSTGIVHPTLVEVSPDDFLGEVPCRLGAGSMQVYVATLHDHGPAPLDGSGGDGNEGLAGAGGASDEIGVAKRSTPVSCGTAVGFADVRPEHRYSVEIQGFDRSDVEVAGLAEAVDAGAEPPEVTDIATGETVMPRWTTTCGRATARPAVVRRIRRCEPLVDHQPSTATAVEVRPDLALGDARCGGGAGEVDHFELTTPTGARTLACGQSLVLDDAAAGRTLVLGVLAFGAAEAAALLGSTCTAEPVAGVTVGATCSPFTDKGALEIDPRDAAAALGLSCEALRELTVTAAGQAPRRVAPSACSAAVPILGLPRGNHSVDIVASAPGAADVVGHCSGDVVPGQRVRATCAAEP